MELFEHFRQGAAFADLALEDLRVPDKPAGIKGMGAKSSLRSSPRALFSMAGLEVKRGCSQLRICSILMQSSGQRSLGRSKFVPRLSNVR